MTELMDRIEALPDDAAMEAVNLLAGDVLGAKPDDEVATDLETALGISHGTLESTLVGAAPAETAAMARVALVRYAEAGEAALVERAIEATGQKALLLEITVVGLLALGLVHTILTRGARETTVESTVSVGEDGTVTMTTHRQTKNYSVGGALGPLAAKLLGAQAPKS